MQLTYSSSPSPAPSPSPSPSCCCCCWQPCSASMISKHFAHLRLLRIARRQFALALALPNYHFHHHNESMLFQSSTAKASCYHSNINCNAQVVETAIEESSLPHLPVLMNEVLEQFKNRCLTSFVDCTLGAGGHASAIIKAHSELQTFIGFDVDPLIHSEARSRIQVALDYANQSSATLKNLQLHLLHTNFKYIKNVLKRVDNDLALTGVNGILMDLGVSSMQQSLKAEDILNCWPEVEIGRILRDYGEERRWKYLAHKIVDARYSGGIQSTSRLVEVIGGRMQYLGKGHMRKHPATRTFQALRIAVNDELSSLETALADAVCCLAPKGRLAVISFHSLEDRIVKHAFLRFSGSKTINNDQLSETECEKDYISKEDNAKVSKSSGRISTCRQFVILTKKPIIPSFEEILRNPRCRSAKLRVIERL
ncbi:hypothetical protein O6H91_19G040800 [Diphasiastrum complanatum]|uniref:Uncharacterized protein n=1 Tax=Diphasiastrum complanatum TaxID=34168 RepID=A0ACC2AUF9_DIPCM|nr:hypothetical protein O6H91_19G040800 [Diphasiastrum complanatum]